MELIEPTNKPVQRRERSQDSAHVFTKSSPTGITLIPQPSDDVKDPLVGAGIFVSDLGRYAGLQTTYAF